MKPIELSGLKLLADFAPSTAYVPTATPVTNVDAVTPTNGWYTVLGDMVICWGVLAWDATAANTFSQFALSLPIAATLANTGDCVGVSAAITVPEALSITADTTNNRALFQGIAGNTSGAHTISYLYAYHL